MQHYWVYIVGNMYMSAIYVGVTGNLKMRVLQHKTKTYQGFTAKYNCDMLLYFEEYGLVNQAIAREKQLKGWCRDKKLELILKMNPNREDLARDWFGVEK